MGRDKGQVRKCLDVVEIYNPDGDFWREGPPMPSPLLSLRTNSTNAGAVDGKLYVCGGFHGAGTGLAINIAGTSWHRPLPPFMRLDGQCLLSRVVRHWQKSGFQGPVACSSSLDSLGLYLYEMVSILWVQVYSTSSTWQSFSS